MKHSYRIRLWILIGLVYLATRLPCSYTLPTVDKGVFVIVGVSTCGNGTGYCILGTECTVDKEFRADDAEGHCDGLKTAFTPRASFVCCKLAETPTTTTVATTSTVQTTIIEELGPPSLESQESEESSSENSIEVEILIPSTTTQIPASSPNPIVEQKTEVNVESSLSLEILCGQHYGPPSGTHARVASQSPITSSCFTAALVRSPTSLFSLSDPGSFLCAGAMVNSDVLLTSATCVSRLYQQDLSLFKVVAGAQHIVHPSHGLSHSVEYRAIKEIHVHPNYTVSGHVRLDDIALVQLEPSDGSSSYCSICLPNEGENWGGSSCLVTGYSHPSDSSDSDGFLHEAPQIIESSTYCNRTMLQPTSNATLREKNGLICGRGEESSLGCFSPRDSGSPLSCSIDGVLKLAGVFSSGFHCGSKESPVLYTDIRKYLPWVKKNLNLN